MQPGKLDTQIIIQSKTITYTQYNEPIESWGDEFEVYADIQMKSSDEAIIASRNVLVNTYDIIVRYNPNITNDMRIYIPCDDIYVQISGIMSHRRQPYMTIKAKYIQDI